MRAPRRARLRGRLRGQSRPRSPAWGGMAVRCAWVGARYLQPVSGGVARYFGRIAGRARVSGGLVLLRGPGGGPAPPACRPIERLGYSHRILPHGQCRLFVPQRVRLPRACGGAQNMLLRRSTRQRKDKTAKRSCTTNDRPGLQTYIILLYMRLSCQSGCATSAHIRYIRPFPRTIYIRRCDCHDATSYAWPFFRTMYLRRP